MTKLFNSTLSLILLTSFALTGCDSGKPTETDLTATDPSTIPEGSRPAGPPTDAVAASTPETSTPEAAASESDSSAEGEKAKTPQEVMQERMEQIQAALKPETLGPLLEKNLGDYQELISGITDTQSAETALPKIKELLGIVRQLNLISSRVPDESKPIVAEKLADAAGTIEEVTQKVLDNKELAKAVNPDFSNLYKTFKLLVQKFPVQAETESDGTDDSDASESDEGSTAEE